MTRRSNGTYAPGVSGNPGGRPRDETHVRELARKRTEQAIKTLADIMENEKAPPAARVSAASVILDRGWGKPLQANKYEFMGLNPWTEILDLVRQIPTDALEAHLEELNDEQRVMEAQRIVGPQDS